MSGLASSRFEALVIRKSCENSNKCPDTWKNIPMMAIMARRPFANLKGAKGKLATVSSSGALWSENIQVKLQAKLRGTNLVLQKQG